METDDLEVGQGDQPNLHTCAHRLTPITGAELPEDVVKVSLDRRRRQAKVLGHSLGCMPLGNSAEDLHFPGGEGNNSALRQRG